MLGRCHVKVAYVEEFSTVWVMKGKHSDSRMYVSVGVAVGVAVGVVVGVDVGVAVGIEVAADAEEFVTSSVLLMSSVLLLVYRWR
jgi:high-affinity Fe2+/Pb2+ permease